MGEEGCWNIRVIEFGIFANEDKMPIISRYDFCYFLRTMKGGCGKTVICISGPMTYGKISFKNFKDYPSITTEFARAFKTISFVTPSS